MMKKTHHCYRSQTENQENIHFLPWKKSHFPPGVAAFFTTRRGGVSTGAFASFNLGGHVGDRPEDVAANRERLLASLPAARELAVANQVHGARAVLAGWEGSQPPPDADAVVTDRPGVVAGVLTADCAPVLLADAMAGVVGAAHAGWRGALGGVLEGCITLMEERGAKRERLVAAIGPCIGVEAYEVETAFQLQFTQTTNKWNQGSQNFFSNRGKSCRVHFDLAGYVHARLIENGLDALKILNLEQCTYALESTFFSHRRAVHQHQAPCGRQLAGIHLL